MGHWGGVPGVLRLNVQRVEAAGKEEIRRIVKFFLGNFYLANSNLFRGSSELVGELSPP